MEMFRNRSSTKKPKVKEMNDLRPVALTSIVMKCLERLVLIEIKKSFNTVQDPLQFAYRAKRCVEDALVVFLDNVYKHIDTPRNYCRVLFVDFSSAFNTIQPHILASKLNDMKLNKTLISWIMEFLTNRPQYVKINDNKSNYIYTNTGAPQGCVISPVLFTIYTNDCSVNDNDVKLIKFADDSSIQGLITNSESTYKDYVDTFTSWCDSHYLLLNVKKTKEMVFDFRKKKDPILPLVLKNEEVEIVQSYKYLGVTIDDKLDWHSHASLVHRKLSQRLYFLRKLREFNIDNKILSLFYGSVVQSVLMFCLCCWGGNCREEDKTKFDRIIKKAGKMTSLTFPFTDQLFETISIRKVQHIIDDKTHPLNTQIIPSTLRQGRYKYLIATKERYKRSFLPFSVKLITLSNK